MAKNGFRTQHGPPTQSLIAASLLSAALMMAAPANAQDAPAAGAMHGTAASGAPAGRLVSMTPQRPMQSVDKSARALTLEAGAGLVVTLGGAAANVFVADPKVAEVRPASATSLFVFGVAPGRTTVAAMDASGKVLTQYALTVRPSAYGAGEAAANIARVVHGGDVHVASTSTGLSLSGRVATAEDASEAVNLAKAYLTKDQVLQNNLTVTTSSIVGLHVKIAEMNRSLTRKLGVNWSALGTLGAIGAFPAVSATVNGALVAGCVLGATCRGAGALGVFDALSQDGLVRTLAEPNLTARSGEAANFLVGGEYPIPISEQYGTVTVDYKQYGVALSFVPTVLSSGRISLHVRPEVSQLSSSGAVQINNGIQIPALTVRRAETTIELGSGESFAIAGLLQDSETQTGSGLPGLGDIPILGALFRSDSFQHNQTELVIVVTPYLVEPTANPAAIKLPTDGYKAPNDIERMLWLRQQGEPSATAALPSSVARIPGSAGFVLQ